MKPGDVYWFEDANGIMHLHVILTHPEPDRSRNSGGRMRVAVVNITTIHTKRYDNTVVLRKGDHPRISEPSYVIYLEANFEYADDLARNGNEVEPLSRDCFIKVWNGMFQGKRLTPEIVRTYCSDRVALKEGEVRNLYEESNRAAPQVAPAKESKN